MFNRYRELSLAELGKILTFVFLVISSAPLFAQQIGKGHFDGSLILKPNPDGRTMTLVEKFSYTDWEHHKITVDAGFTSDGATIPRVVWSIVGAPWDGKYRNAAVIHDKGCESHQYSWQITHRLFYEAMLDSGVTKPQALTMYYAVLAAGPRWELIAIKTASSEQELESEVASFKEAKAQEGSLVSLLSSEKIVVTTEVVTDLKNPQYKAKIFESLPTNDSVTKDELKNLLSTAEAREKTANPMTPDEVNDLVLQKERLKMKYTLQESIPTKLPS